MNTLKLLNDYKLKLAPILNCLPENIVFYKNNTTIIGELVFPDEEGCEDEINEWRSRYYKVRVIENEIPRTYVCHIYGFGDEKREVRTENVASFELTEMPTCNTYLISSQARVVVELQNKGIGTILNSLRRYSKVTRF